MMIIIFYTAAFIVTLSLLFLIVQNHPVVSLFSLVLATGGFSLLYIQLGSPLLALAQVMITGTFAFLFFTWHKNGHQQTTQNSFVSQLRAREIGSIGLVLVIFLLMASKLAQLPPVFFSESAQQTQTLSFLGQALLTEHKMTMCLLALAILTTMVAISLLVRSQQKP